MWFTATLGYWTTPILCPFLDTLVQLRNGAYHEFYQRKEPSCDNYLE